MEHISAHVSHVWPMPSATLWSTGRHKTTGKQLHTLKLRTHAWKGRVPNDAACSSLYAANSQALVATVLPSPTCRMQNLFRHSNLFSLREVCQSREQHTPVFCCMRSGSHAAARLLWIQLLENRLALVELCPVRHLNGNTGVRLIHFHRGHVPYMLDGEILHSCIEVVLLPFLGEVVN